MFADDVGAPFFKGIEAVGQGSKLFLYVILAFAAALVILTVVLLLLRKKFVKGKDKHTDYVELP